MARRDWLITCGLFTVAIGVRLWLLPAPVHDYDEGAYWQSLLAMQHGYAQYRDIFVSQPPLFLDATYVFFTALGKTLVAARAAALFGSALNIACASWIAYRLCGRVAAIAALAFVGFNNVDLEESVTLQAEGLAVGLATLSVALAIECSRRTSRRSGIVIAAGAVAACAIFVKLLTIPCIVVFLVLSLTKRDGRAIACYGAGAAAAGALIITPHLSALHQIVAQSVFFHLNSHVTLPKTGFSAMARGIQVPLLLFCIAGIVIAIRRRDIPALSIAAWFAVVCLSFATIAPLFEHHLDAIQPPLSILAAYCIARSLDRVPGLARVGAVVAVILTGALYAVPELHNIWNPQFRSRLSTSDLQKLAPHDKWIITDLQATAAAAGYETPPDLVDTSFVRVLGGNLTNDQLIRDAKDARVGAIAFGGRRLSLPQLQQFSRWVRVHFHKTASPFIWTR